MIGAQQVTPALVQYRFASVLGLCIVSNLMTELRPYAICWEVPICYLLARFFYQVCAWIPVIWLMTRLLNIL